ncbi:MAG: AraC family transcriptional regulator [Eubacteriales bacterium]|nr:AraC family transcriptional regulator [Eubacteriales bacterium]
MDLLAQLNHAMAYIEEHISDDLALEDVSTVTSYSHYHFGRLFYYIAEMPLSEYIRKRKLTLAAEELQGYDTKVIDLAMKYGYDSTDGFTRAFRAQHGVTPSEARTPGVSLTIFLPLTFQIKIKGVQGMNWRIEEREAFEVFGIERIFGNDEVAKVPDFWTEQLKSGEYERLYQAAGAKRESGGLHCINAVCGYNEVDGDRFPYMICAVKKPDSDTTGFKTAQIPAQTWAVFRNEKHDPQRKKETPEMGDVFKSLMDRIYQEWLPSSGYEWAPAPDLEMYYTDDVDGMNFEEAWIPVKKA